MTASIGLPPAQAFSVFDFDNDPKKLSRLDRFREDTLARPSLLRDESDPLLGRLDSTRPAIVGGRCNSRLLDSDDRRICTSLKPGEVGCRFGGVLGGLIETAESAESRREGTRG